MCPSDIPCWSGLSRTHRKSSPPIQHSFNAGCGGIVPGNSESVRKTRCRACYVARQDVHPLRLSTHPRTAILSPMPSFGALAPFRIRSYRFQWPADLLTSWAFEMETLVLGWYVLVETNSVVMLTIFGALLYGGTLIAPIVGVWSDRIGHRNMLTGMRAIYALVAATLTTLAFTGTLHPNFVLVLAGV